MTARRKKPKDEYENPLKKLIDRRTAEEEEKFQESERQFKRKMMALIYYGESD